MAYLIVCTMTYSGRPEYFNGFDEVSHRVLWTEDAVVAVRFADQASARKTAAAALSRPAYIMPVDEKAVTRQELAKAKAR